MREVNTQIGISMTSDFEEYTWTFLMPKGFQVWAGKFAIVDKQVYDKMLAALKAVDDCHDVYCENMGMSNRIFEQVYKALESAQPTEVNK